MICRQPLHEMLAGSAGPGAPRPGTRPPRATRPCSRPRPPRCHPAVLGSPPLCKANGSECPSLQKALLRSVIKPSLIFLPLGGVRRTSLRDSRECVNSPLLTALPQTSPAAPPGMPLGRGGDFTTANPSPGWGFAVAPRSPLLLQPIGSSGLPPAPEPQSTWEPSPQAHLRPREPFPWAKQSCP